MYHFVARVYISQNVCKLQRRRRPRPWSLELFYFAFCGSRHWRKRKVCCAYAFVTRPPVQGTMILHWKTKKNMVATQFLRSHVTINEFRTTRYERIYGTNRYARWRLWRLLLSTSSATLPWFLTIASTKRENVESRIGNINKLSLLLLLP